MQNLPSTESHGAILDLLRHSKESVEIFIRHTRDYPHLPRGRDFRKCGCPKYLYVYQDGLSRKCEDGLFGESGEESANDARCLV